MPIIDVHAHCLPESYLAAMKAEGVHDCEGFRFPSWSEDAHLATMDRNGITSSILSISAPGLHPLSGGTARDAARRVNEDAAERRERTGGRLGAFAVLTLPDVEGALAEIAYALDHLKLDGIGLLTNVHGTYLGDSAFEPVFAELDRRAATVFVHPVGPSNYQDLALGFSASALEYPFDTTRMLMNLLATGTLRRYRRFKLIAAHGGGTVPYLAWRMAGISPYFNRLDPPITSPEVESLLRGVYYECTAICNPVSFKAYRAFASPDKRLFGTDTPFMPESDIGPARTVLASEDVLAEAERSALDYENAVALFPDLARRLGLESSPRTLELSLSSH